MLDESWNPLRFRYDHLHYGRRSGDVLAIWVAHLILNQIPYLLSKIVELTSGKSLESNIALIKNNAKLAGEIAVKYNEKK